MGSLRDREVACSTSDRQDANLEFCVWRAVSPDSSQHPHEVFLLVQLSLCVPGGLKTHSFHFILPDYSSVLSAMRRLHQLAPANVMNYIIITYHVFKCYTCIYLLGFYTFQGVFFATINKNMQLFYLWFWCWKHNFIIIMYIIF